MRKISSLFTYKTTLLVAVLVMLATIFVLQAVMSESTSNTHLQASGKGWYMGIWVGKSPGP
ncbi:MAG TPA: hypothetical protein VMG59_07995 [Phycisphaerae bacterium]|nr:hypothetical protein [Phycisphaerae bacterium]